MLERADSRRPGALVDFHFAESPPIVGTFATP